MAHPQGGLESLVQKARVERDAAGYAALDRVAESVTDACLVVDAEQIEMTEQEGGYVPIKLKERIRALGPTVRLDLGKQAVSASHLERIV